MAAPCSCCAGVLRADDLGYACAKRVFGTDFVPRVDATSDTASVTAVVGQLSEKLSGVQPKFSVDLQGDALVPEAGGRWIAKPPHMRWHALPENEHTTMCLARLLGIETAEFALLEMRDGATAYVVRRFDRVDDSDEVRKLEQFDFCQLLDLPPTSKYGHDSAVCAEVVKQFSVEPALDLERLYTLIVFSYWMGNGDLHLKNLSLLDRGDGLRFSPAYDLVSTLLYGDDKLALFVDGKTKDVRRKNFVAFGASCGLEKARATELLDALLGREAEVVSFLESSTLKPDARAAYARNLGKRRRALTL